MLFLSFDWVPTKTWGGTHFLRKFLDPHIPMYMLGIITVVTCIYC